MFNTSKEDSPTVIIWQKIVLLSSVFILSCTPTGNVQVKGVNPDSEPPKITFLTTAPDTMNGNNDFELKFEVRDNKSVRDAVLYYSPDGSVYTRIGNFSGGLTTTQFCAPNKNHIKPTFKVVASDNNGNKAEGTLGLEAGKNFTINITEPAFPQISSSEGLVTNETATEILVDTCDLGTSCSGGAIYYEVPNPDIYIGVGATSATATYISCDDVKDNGYTLPAFGGDGDVTYHVWVKQVDPETLAESVTSTSSDITVHHDGTDPAPVFNIAAGAMTSHADFLINYDLTDASSGIDSGKIYYTPNKSNLVTYPYVEIGDLTAGTGNVLKFCVPNKNHPNGSFRLRGTDEAGNVKAVDLDGFTITRTANNLLPSSTSLDNVATPLSAGNVKVHIDACKQTVCSVGDLQYENPDNQVYIAVGAAAPAAGSASWVSCSDVLTNGYTANVPNNVGSGNYVTALWVKSSNKDIDGVTDVNTISTSSIALNLPYDYVAPDISDIDLGNLGDHLNLSILGTNILTGYSQGSFKLAPICLDPTFIPAVQTWIAGTVIVDPNNVNVTGSGTSFLNEFAANDYTEINGQYVQIKSVTSNTQLVLNEIIGNNSLIVGGPFQASKAMKPYGGIRVSKGLGGPPAATGTDWQSCDSINQTIRYGNLVSGVNNLQFWVKDSGNNVASTPITYSVTYNPPILTVVDGPTVSTSTANLTINACGGGTKISKVFFNETGVKPVLADAWQNCSTSTGALSSPVLTPGNHTLKAYFLYTDGFISENPVNVTVNYLPEVEWQDSDGITNNPNISLTVTSCAGISEVMVNQGGSGDPGTWVPCATALANGLDFTLPGSNGGNPQTVNIWYKDDGGNISPDHSETEVTFIPPSAYKFGDTTVDTTNPPLTIESCENISHVYVKLDDATHTAPAAGAGGWIACTTAMNGIPTPAMGSEGAHQYDVWFKFDDGTVLPSPYYSPVNVVYNAPDITPPPIGSLTLNLENGDGSGPPPTIVSDGSRAFFTLNDCSPTADPEDDISEMILTTVNTAPSSGDEYWQSCSTVNSAFKSRTLSDGTYTLYAWFKDSAGNISSPSIATSSFIIDTNGDVTPPSRPLVSVNNAPTITTSPADLKVAAGGCSDVDQVYVKTGAAPLADAAGWQDCSEVYGNISYFLDLKGSYTLNVYFKDSAGNVNPTPREVSFIFDPPIGNLPNPVAYWTMDKNHVKKNRIIDLKGERHLYLWNPTEVTEVTGWDKEARRLTGSNSYLFTENTSTLKPTTAVTISMWAYLTANDAGTKGLAGNGDYGFKLDGGNLKFYASGDVPGHTVSVATSSYTTGWKHLIGTSDGQNINFYINGLSVGTPITLGSPANLTYGSSQLFVVGGFPNGAQANPLSSGLFDEKIDEVVVWNQYFTDEMATVHYIDTYNHYKVKQDSVKPANIAGATFHGEFLQNALLTLSSCGDAKFIYVDETTHPPTANSSRWQPCNTVAGGIIHEGLSQGYHELKIWAKDEYENISNSYQRLDTTITSVTYQANGLAYYTLDNTHNNISSLYEIFSGQTALSVGADANQAAIQNEGYRFVRASSDFIERKYAYNSQPTDKITISIWANLTNGDTRSQVLAGTRTTNHGYALEIEGNELRFNVETSGGVRTAGVPVGSYTSGFHNIIGIYDGRYTKLYIDAVKVDEYDGVTTLPIQYTCLGSFMIGAGSSCNTGPVAGTYFDNILDEVIVWNDAIDGNANPDQVADIVNGQDTIPPSAVAVTPKNNDYSVDVPIVKLNVSDCSDIASVYVSLDATKPLSDIANWQACSTLGDEIKSPLLETGSNNVKVWFRDMAGNVSDTSTDLTITMNYVNTIPNPQSYWTFDDVNIDGAQVFDVINANNGINTGAVEEEDGKIDESLTFDGINDFVEIPYNSDSVTGNNPTSELSLATWFKVPDFNTGGLDQYLIGNLNDGGYAIILNNGNLRFDVTINGVIQTVSVDVSALNTANWHHVTATYDGSGPTGTLRIFIDGVEDLPATTVAGPNLDITYNNNNSLVIGAAAPQDPATTGNSGNFFQGELDEVAQWDDALTDTVVADLYDRGQDGDQLYYNTDPPEIPISTNLIYYNSLVSRANLTVNSCEGLDYVIVTKDEFPPDKNDPDWQLCNTLVGGILSKELSTSDAFGKLWTRDNFGNVSRNYEYVAVSTKYDKPISRPVVHWTFDNDHYIPATRKAFDRLSQINLTAETLRNTDVTPQGCSVTQVVDSTTTTLITNQSGVLNQSFDFTSVATGPGFDIGGTWIKPVILRSNHPENIKTKSTDKLTVSAWAYITGNTAYTYDKHIVSNMVGTKGWAIRLLAPNTTSGGLRFTVYTDKGLIEPYIETVNIATGWHLVTGTFDGSTGTASLFMDGIFVKSFSVTPPAQIIYESGTNTFIGAQASTTSMPTRGQTANDVSVPCMAVSGGGVIADNSYYRNKVDEVIIWDKALSKLEISSLYHNGADILYELDVTEPTIPSLTRENTRPDMFTNKVHFTVNNCYTTGPLADVISGVLVNEGTRPDKQDERWESCRTRPGSFGLTNLTPDGHTVTTWFKDLAGNVTSASTDLVVNYITSNPPSANIFWPLDSSHNISKYTRDVIDNKVHDLLMVNVETPLNPSATQVAGVVQEGLNLASTSTTNGAFLFMPTTKYLRPVNYFSLGGWFYLTNGDTATKTLIDHHRNRGATLDIDWRYGYKLEVSGSNLRFYSELYIGGQRLLQVPTSSYTTGWHHVLGVFTGYDLYLYLDGVQVSHQGPFAERDIVTWGSNVTTDFKVGAEINPDSNGTNALNENPIQFFGEKVDEIGLWGFDLTASQVGNLRTTNMGGTHAYYPVPSPSNVDNAYIYHYDNFGSRARMTIMDCTNTPYILVNARNSGIPADDDADWRNCRTEPGAIISTKLPLNTTYVDVYAKNSDGVISSTPGWKEINSISLDHDLTMPITYFSFNANQVSGGVENDFVINSTATLGNGASRIANLDGDGINFSANNQYIDIPSRKIYDLRKSFTFGALANINPLDATKRHIISRNLSGDRHDTGILIENGLLTAYANLSITPPYYRSDAYIRASYPLKQITAGKHFVVGSYDGKNMRLYVDSMLVNTTNTGYLYWTTDVDRTIAMDGIAGFRLGNNVENAIQGEVDEFLLFDRVLNEQEIVAWYRRYSTVLNSGDSTPPANGRTLAVNNSTFGVNWPTNDSNPSYSINSCADISGVYVVVNSATPPEVDDTGWQLCQDGTGAGITSPTLAVGNNTVYFYYKDQFGNISAPDTITVNYSAPPLYDPVAYWNFDDTALVSGNKNYEPINQLHAELYGIRPSDFVAGPSGKGILFDGYRKYARVSHNTIIKPTQELSVSFWMDVPGGVSGNGNRSGDIPVGNRNSSTQEGFVFGWSWGNPTTGPWGGIGTTVGDFFEFRLTLDEAGTPVDTIVEYPQDLLGSGLMHIAATFDGRYIKLYRNGVEIRRKDLLVKKTIYYHPTNNTSLTIGAMSGLNHKPSTGYANFLIDEVAIWNKAILPAHVTTLYNSGTPARIYNNPSYAVDDPLNSEVSLYEPSKKTYGNRIRITMSNCTNKHMILVNDSTVAPSASNENWQACNTKQGGILSAPLSAGAITPIVWAKTFEGVVSSSYAQAPAITISADADLISRPKVYWSLDSTHVNATNIDDILSWSTGEISASGVTSNATGIGLGSVAAASSVVTVDTTSLVVGDRVRIGDEILQVKTIDTPTQFTSENNHIAGSAATPSYKIATVNGVRSALEAGEVFDGTSGYISVTPTAGSVPFYDITISAWAELKRGDTLYRHIVGNTQNCMDNANPNNPCQNNDNAGVALQVKNGYLQFVVTTLVGPASSSVRAIYTAQLDNDTYATGLHHITGSYDGKILKLYLDGVLKAEQSLHFYGVEDYQIFHDDYSHWTIGAETGSANAPLANSYQYGMIDDVNIWHNALTDQEIYAVYSYGAANIPVPLPEASPTDPGIAIRDGKTEINTPWAQFSIPSCTGANGKEIDGIYISTSATPPAADDSAWQYCSLDNLYFNSGIIDPGSTTIYIYYRNNQGVVSNPAARTVTVNYTAPTMPNPNAYYTYDSADSFGGYGNSFYDMAGAKHIRYGNNIWPADGKVAGKVDQAWRQETAYNQPHDVTYRVDYNMTQNFSVSFWVQPYLLDTIAEDIINQGQFKVTRTNTDRILLTTNAGGTSYTLTSSKVLNPNTWNHVAATRIGNIISIYLDGKFDSYKVITSSNLNANSSKLSFNTTQQVMDEMILYDQGLSADQVAYIYYKGTKGQNVEVYKPNENKRAPTPDYLWTFDTSTVAGGYVDSVVNSLPMKLINGVSSGQTVAASKAVAGEAFFFDRHEDTVTGTPDPAKGLEVLGDHQYLESDSPAPLNLGTDFTIMAWVKQPNPYGTYITGPGSENTDDTAIIDMWGSDDANKAFRLTYKRGSNIASAAMLSNAYFEFKVRVSGTDYVLASDAREYVDNIRPSYVTAFPGNADLIFYQVVIRRKGKVLSMFINGLESASLETLPEAVAVQVPLKTRLRMGESNFYPYLGSGTWSIASGGTAVTGVGSQFMTDLWENKVGTVTVAAGGTAVTGAGTRFTTEFLVGQTINIAGELKVINTITSSNTMTLTSAHVAGAAGVVASGPIAGDIRIGTLNFKIASITDNTNLTVKTPVAASAQSGNVKYSINYGAATVAATVFGNQVDWDEYNLHGYLDDLAIWNSALTQKQIYDLKTRGQANESIPYTPVVEVVGVNGSTTVNTDTAQVIVNDCNGFTHIWAGFAASVDPLAGDGGWVACTDGMTLDTQILTINSVNNLKFWFKTGGVVSGYTTTATVTHSSGDTTPPVVAGITVTMVARGNNEPFAKFSLNTCADVAGVFVGTSAPTTSTQAGWQNCTTVAGGIISPPLSVGVNSLRVWMKDTAGNFAEDNDSPFSATFTPDNIADPSFYLTMDNDQVSSGTLYQVDIANNEIAVASHATNVATGFEGAVKESASFTSNAYYELPNTTVALTDELSFSSWVKINLPGTDSQLVGQWNDAHATNSYAIRINSFGRLCLDYQTTASAGAADWNTNKYGRVCSSFSVNTGSWNHVGLIRDGAAVKFFLNGQLTNTVSINASDFITSALTTRIGAQARGTNNSGTEGLLDEVSLWNVALTNINMQTMYAHNIGGSSTFGEVDPTPVVPNFYWALENLTASYGGINLLTTGSDPVGPMACKVNNCYDFNVGSSQYLATAATNMDLTGDFTIATWVNPSAIAVSDIINKWDGTNKQFKFSLNVSGQVIFNYNLTTSGQGSITSVGALATSSWYHLAVVRRGQWLYLYVNRKIQKIANIGANTMVNVSNPVTLGGNSVDGTSYFDGLIDDVSIYQDDLNYRKLLFNYNKGFAGNPLP